MAIPKVNLKKIRRQSGIFYQPDFRVNNRRFRESVGSDKRQAELIRLQRVNEIVNGKFNLPGTTKTKVDLDSQNNTGLVSNPPTSLDRFLPA
jgi:hypothetical protein